ncbi:hypothetical protein [Methylobacterium sp. SD21]|uniref:hypothetical protein n=1 Tax=Methylobacterium litchii TaxID=3138810 RepID=UPI00313C8E28
MASDVAPLPDLVAGWRAALDNLSPHASPCRYLAPAKWAAIRESGIDFCDRLGTEAHRLGWTAAELFTVHPEHGTTRVDACGVLIIGPEPARGVEASLVRFERPSGHRNGQGGV